MCYHDEIGIFLICNRKPFYNISSLYEKKTLHYFQWSIFVPDFFEFLLICKLANWWYQKINKMLTKYDEESYLCQFVSEMFDSL